jgi:protease I
METWMASKKILMLVGDFVEGYEAMGPFQMLTMVGHAVEVVCPGSRVCCASLQTIGGLA